MNDRCRACNGPVEKYYHEFKDNSDYGPAGMDRIRAISDTLEACRQEWKDGDGGTELRMLDRFFNPCSECGREPLVGQPCTLHTNSQTIPNACWQCREDAKNVQYAAGQRDAYAEAAELFEDIRPHLIGQASQAAMRLAKKLRRLSEGR